MTKLNTKVKSYTEVYSNYFPVIYSTVYTKIGNADDTQDICQEVFSRFFLKFDEVEDPRKWLYGTMRLVILEYYKKSKKHSGSDIDNELNDVSLTFVNAFKDTRLLIEEAMNKIDEMTQKGDRILFELIAIRNLSYKQAGRELGIPKHKVRYRYNQIVDHLLDYFKSKGINSLEELL